MASATSTQEVQKHTAGELAKAPFLPGGVGDQMLGAAYAYLDEYVLSTEGDDHEPTDFERVLLEDFVNGLISDERFFGPVRAAITHVPDMLEALQLAERLYQNGIMATPSEEIARVHEARRAAIAKAAA